MRTAAFGLVVAVQLATAGPLDAPFLDTRLHVQSDNAWFAFMARGGLRNGDARSQLGVTLNRYSRWGERLGPPAYYTHHPFLMKTAFQLFARALGTGESAPRAFALLIAIGIAAAALHLVASATGSLWAGTVAALTLASWPVFARFQTTLKFESDGMLAGMAFLLSLERTQRRPGRPAVVLLGAAAALAALAHWTAALAVACTIALLAWRWWRRRRRELLSQIAAAAAGLAAGELVLAALLVWLSRGVEPAWRSLMGGFETRASVAAVPLGDWAARQWLFLRENFTVPALVALGALAAVAVVAALRRPRGEGGDQPHDTWLLRLATLATLATGIAWVVAFRQGSYVHSYWQLWLALPAAFAAGEAAARARRRPRLAAAAGATSLALIVYCQSVAGAERRALAEAQLGTPAEIELLTSLRQERFTRFVYVALSTTPFNEWFSGPLFEYYTDRPVHIAGASQRLSRDDRVLLVRRPEQAGAASGIAARLGVRLTDERCGGRICSYAVEPLR